MASHLDILGVQAFVSIAELGSFRAAANHLHLSQSALGRRLKKLEGGLGVQLLSRTTRSVSISAEGADFLPQARRVIEDLGAALDGLKTGNSSQSGIVRVGCLPTIAALMMPTLLRAYAREYPQVRVLLLDRSGTEIRDAVLAGEVDFAITAAGLAHENLISERLFVEPMMAVFSSENPLAKRRSVSWTQLAGEPLISIGMMSANRALIESHVRQHSLDLSWAYQVEHIATAVALIAGGSGVAILPASAVVGRARNSDLRVLPLRSPSLSREIVLLSRKLPLHSKARALALLVHEQLQGYRLIA